MSREKMLHRERIVSSIEKVCSANYKKFAVSELVHISGHRHRVEIEADGSYFYMDFHFKENGSTAIDIASGHRQHVDKKKQIMKAVLSDSECLIDDSKTTEDSVFG